METGLARLDLEAGRTDGKVVESDNRLRFGVDFTMVATATRGGGLATGPEEMRLTYLISPKMKR